MWAKSTSYKLSCRVPVEILAGDGLIHRLPEPRKHKCSTARTNPSASSRDCPFTEQLSQTDTSLGCLLFELSRNVHSRFADRRQAWSNILSSACLVSPGGLPKKCLIIAPRISCGGTFILETREWPGRLPGAMFDPLAISGQLRECHTSCATGALAPCWSTLSGHRFGPRDVRRTLVQQSRR